MVDALTTGIAEDIQFPVSLSPEVTIDGPASIDVNAKDVEQWCALHYAAYEGHADVVKKLCELKANPHEGQNSGSNALQVAVGMGQKDVVRALVDVLPSNTVHELIAHRNKEGENTRYILTHICGANRSEIAALLHIQE